MILTGKVLEDFNKWFSEKYGNFKTTTFQECASAPEYEVFFDEIKLPNEVENSLIIEWFDSVGIYIGTPPFFDKDAKYNRGFESLVYQDNSNIIIESFNDNDVFYNRQEATEQAIIHANKLYNERTNISNKI